MVSGWLEVCVPWPILASNFLSHWLSLTRYLQKHPGTQRTQRPTAHTQPLREFSESGRMGGPKGADVRHDRIAGASPSQSSANRAAASVRRS